MADVVALVVLGICILLIFLCYGGYKIFENKVDEQRRSCVVPIVQDIECGILADNSSDLEQLEKVIQKKKEEKEKEKLRIEKGDQSRKMLRKVYKYQTHVLKRSVSSPSIIEDIGSDSRKSILYRSYNPESSQSSIDQKLQRVGSSIRHLPPSSDLKNWRESYVNLPGAVSDPVIRRERTQPESPTIIPEDNQYLSTSTITNTKNINSVNLSNTSLTESIPKIIVQDSDGQEKNIELKKQVTLNIPHKTMTKAASEVGDTMTIIPFGQNKEISQSIPQRLNEIMR